MTAVLPPLPAFHSWVLGRFRPPARIALSGGISSAGQVDTIFCQANRHWPLTEAQRHRDHRFFMGAANSGPPSENSVYPPWLRGSVRGKEPFRPRNFKVTHYAQLTPHDLVRNFMLHC